MAPPRTCECGECKKCLNRQRSFEYYRHNAEKVREISKRSRARRIEAIRATRKPRKKDPVKVKAVNAVNNAIIAGRLTRLPCEVCGDPQSQGHHEDYSKPLDVRWLCREHHMELHRTVAA